VRRPLLVVAAACGLAPCGCATGGPSDEQQVRDVLQTFARAAQRRDFQTVCDRVLAPKLLDGLQQIGLPCEVALRNSLGQVRNPRLTVGAVTVKDDHATAQVRTAADNQAPSRDVVRLDKVKAGWRISSLGTGRGTP
jgi:hypothetical protein